MDTKRQVAAFLRKAIQDSRVSQCALAKAVGITQPAVSLFLNGKDGLKLATLDKLLDYFGMELTLRPKSTSPSAGRPPSPTPEAEPTPVVQQGPPPPPRPPREAPKPCSPLPSRSSPPVTETFGVPEQQWKRLR